MMASPGQIRPPASLQRMPQNVLEHVVAHVLIVDSSQAINMLTQYGSRVHNATAAVLLNHVVLHDDDAVLVQAERGPLLSRNTVITSITTNKTLAGHVKRLTILPASLSDQPKHQDAPLSPSESGSVIDEHMHALHRLQPLDDSAFLLLVSQLPKLQRLVWRTNRSPPSRLCLTLGAVSRNLSHLTIDPAEDQSVSSSQFLESPGKRVTSSHRWDAPSLASLGQIDTLVQLSLGNLSQQGSKQLGIAMPSLNLESFDIGNTLFVDDALLASIGATAKRLKRLRIFEMTGGKLTDVGVEAILRGCTALEELDFDCVEGRLSKTCWCKVAEFPESLATLRFVYSEVAPHKSWVLDHLASISAIMSLPTLTSLSVLRKPHPEALLPGQHNYAVYTPDQLLAPRPLPESWLTPLLTKGIEWQELGLDLYTLELASLKKVMEYCTKLNKLQVSFEGEFRTLLTMTASFALCTNLRQFIVSIDPERTTIKPPQIQLPFTPAQSPDSKRPALPSGPNTAYLVPDSPPHARRISASVSNSTSISAISPRKADDVPLPREWRRFLKKSHRLEQVTWGGRGGVGTWHFDREKTGSLGAKIEFEPLGVSAEDDSRYTELVTVATRHTDCVREGTVSLQGTPLENLTAVEPEPHFGSTTSPLSRASSPEVYRASKDRDSCSHPGDDAIGLGLSGLSLGAIGTPSPSPQHRVGRGQERTDLGPSAFPTDQSPKSVDHSPSRTGRRSSWASTVASSSSPALTSSSASTPSPTPIVYPGGWRSAKKEKERNERRRNKASAAAAASRSPESSSGSKKPLASDAGASGKASGTSRRK